MKPGRILAARLAAGLAAVIVAAGAAASPTSPLAPDHGRFRILLRGRVVGTEDFAISRDGRGWSEHSTIQVNVPKRPGERDTANLTLAADGAPIRYHWLGQSAQARSIDVAFGRHSATVTLHRHGSPPAVETFSFPAGRPLVLLDNNVYAQYAILARLYDWRAGGPQKFSVLIPQDQVPGTVTVESAGRRTVDGKRLDRLTVRSPDLEVDLYVDAARRLYLVRVPGSGAEVVRE